MIPLDISRCNDTLTNTIDYAQLCDKVTAFVSSQSFQLIETVAEQVAAFIKTTFSIQQLTLKVSKPYAVSNAGLIQVIVER